MFVLQEGTTFAVDPKRLSKVPLQELFPLRRIKGGQMRSKLDLGEQATRVLRRSATVIEQPRCSIGHAMMPGPRVLPMRKRPACSVCHQEGLAGNPAQVFGSCLSSGDTKAFQCIKCNFFICARCVEEGYQVGAFSDVLNRDTAAKLLAKPHLLKYKAHCYYDRADYNWSDDLDQGELSSLLERISWELDMKFSVANKLRRGQGMGRQAFVQLFTDILTKSADTDLHSCHSGIQHSQGRTEAACPEILSISFAFVMVLAMAHILRIGCIGLLDLISHRQGK